MYLGAGHATDEILTDAIVYESKVIQARAGAGMLPISTSTC